MNYDERECPKCHRTVCMYEQPLCQSCTPQQNKIFTKPDTPSKKQVWADFYENGFQ